jgi:hypothetical protein
MLTDHVERGLRYLLTQVRECIDYCRSVLSLPVDTDEQEARL